MKVGRLAARASPRWLPFADVVSDQLPMSRLIRLGLFQVSVGMTMTLLAGTINRVMIIELGVGATLVALLLALPMLLAPLRAALGHWSDEHRSAFGWRRVPYLWFGTLGQFGGFAILPFGLILLGESASRGQAVAGLLGSAVGFLLVGLGAHTVQTAGLALATDQAAEEQRPRVVALLYLLLLVGMALSAIVLGWLLYDYSSVRLIKVIQGAAVVTLVLNGIGLWKQEAMDPSRAAAPPERTPFADAWSSLVKRTKGGRLLVAVGLGAAGFGMQDILLEPYGGEVMGMTVGQTSLLTGLMAGGAILALTLSARWSSSGRDPFRLAGIGALVGIGAFALVVLAAPLGSTALLQTGTGLMGFGGGLFTIGTLVAAMQAADGGEGSGLAVGAWGAVYTSCAGLAVAVGGLARDVIQQWTMEGLLGPGLSGAPAGYIVIYHFEILALFLALAAIGPMAGPMRRTPEGHARPFGLSELPS